MNALPDIVYKYFNWADIESRRIFTHNELYFCNARKWKNFGEFDLRFKPIDKERLVENIEREAERMRNYRADEYERWFNTHLRIYNIDFSKYNVLPPHERDLYETQTLERISLMRANELIHKPETYERLMRQFYFKHTGIFSTSLSKEAATLWEWKKRFNAVLNNNAICIGLNLLIIKQKLDTIGNYAIGLINYNGNKNEIELIERGDNFFANRLISISHTLPKDKVKNIEDQKELRILKFLVNGTSDNALGRFLTLDRRCVMEVVVHENAEEHVKSEVSKISEANNWKVSFYTETK